MMLDQEGNMKLLKIIDPDSGETVECEECRTCSGLGGEDWSTDCEAYDDWRNCVDCDGHGYVEVGYFDREIFVAERDAWTPND
jgi:hypothetical protein